MAGRKAKVQYVKQETPAFIQKFKEKVGYKEPDNVDSKFTDVEKSSRDDDDDHEGEKPVVVLGRDVSQAEADEFLSIQDRLEEESKEEDNAEGGKFIFKKPIKRKLEEAGPNEGKKSKDKSKHKKSSSMKKVKNTTLLSFGDDEEEHQG